MSSMVPVLALVKSNWEAIEDQPIIGKDVLELLSSSMYVNPLSIYREYVQNAMDSIEEAIALGSLAVNRGRIDIIIDAQNRQARIRDNGTGIPRNIFAKTLIALGASKKRGTKARGFRGVGRLAGLGYCKELVFRSRAEGEKQVSELRWDCRRLKALLANSQVKLNVDGLIKDLVRIRHLTTDGFPARFFEVELNGIMRHSGDYLIDTRQVHDYLSQVAPVPFAPNFAFAKRIHDELSAHVSLGNILIYLNGSKTPIYRPHADEFEIRRGVRDRFSEIKFLDIKDSDGHLAAKAWFLQHGYHGAIGSGALIKGLRLRSGNIQIGESNLLDELFTESRFNSWVVGEIHVLDERILPNGRRDHFEQNVYFNDLLNKLRPVASELACCCRMSSLSRNAIRQFESLQVQVKSILSILQQGAVSPVQSHKLKKQAIMILHRMDKASSHPALTLEHRRKFTLIIKRLQHKLREEEVSKRRHRILKQMPSSQQKIWERFITLLYEYSPNKIAAKTLVDHILRRLQ